VGLREWFGPLMVVYWWGGLLGEVLSWVFEPSILN
jgi:hypothetical protein